MWSHLKYTSVTSLDVDLRKWKPTMYLKIGRRFEDWTSIRDWTSIWILHIYCCFILSCNIVFRGTFCLREQHFYILYVYGHGRASKLRNRSLWPRSLFFKQLSYFVCIIIKTERRVRHYVTVTLTFDHNYDTNLSKTYILS